MAEHFPEQLLRPGTDSPGCVQIGEIKEQIRQRAAGRQERIIGGEGRGPLRYSPTPLGRLEDLLSQLAYRRDSLGLAVPPLCRPFRERLKRWLKQAFCLGLRWLFIRQVEFNTVVLRHARHSARLLVRSDQKRGELIDAINGLRMQMNTLMQRMARLEAGSPDVGDPESAAMAGMDTPLTWNNSWTAAPEIQHEVHQALARYFRTGPGPVLLLGCGSGDFLKHLVSEGVAAQGIENDPIQAEFCRDRDLPVIRAEAFDYLAKLKDDSVGGIYLGPILRRLSPQEILEFIRCCWLKLNRGAVLIAETWNPLCAENDSAHFLDASQSRRVPVEILWFLLESQCFSVVNCIFSDPALPAAEPWVETRANQSCDGQAYRRYAIVGRK